MDRYGLTEQEKMTNLQDYNHALFNNMMFFMDFVWEINIKTGTAVIIDDKTDTDNKGVEFIYQEMYTEYLTHRVSGSERITFAQYFEITQLQDMMDERSVDIHLLSPAGESTLFRFVLTPARDENGLYCVYIGARNMQAEENREIVEFRNQRQFRDALLSNSFFHFTIDISGDAIIHADYTTCDGYHLIREITGRDLPIHNDLFVQKWFEVYKPRFVKETTSNPFTIDALRQAYARGERLIEAEVKQKQISSEKRTYIRILAVLTEDPKDQHIHSTMIWHDIRSSRQTAIDHNLDLQSSNEQLQETLSQEEQFRLATVSNSMLVYNVNVTQNRIEDEFYQIVDGKRYPMLEMIGLKAPCSFDEFCERWSAAKVAEDSRTSFLKLYNRKHMLDSFEKGEQHLEMECDMTAGRNILMTTRNSAVLFKNQHTGDVIAMMSSQDISGQRKEEREQREAIRKANEDLQAALQSEKEKLSIIGSLARIYISLHLLHLDENRYEELDADPKIHTMMKNSGKIDCAFSRIIREAICEEHIPAARKFLDLSTLDKRMQGRTIISHEFEGKFHGWCRASFIALDNEKLNSGHISDVIYVVQQIDEEKKKEIKASEALREAYASANRASTAKSDFLARMSHDIRTPMNAIIGMTTIAETELDDPEAISECLHKIHVSSKHLLGLINEVLDMSKIESGPINLQPKEFRLSDVIDNLLRANQEKAEKKHHELTVSTEGIQHVNVVGDDDRIGQAFSHILENAINYTPDGGKIRVSLTEKPTNRPRIGCYEFTVEDNGIGIPDDFIPHMFEPFTRAADERVEQIPGTGLGLPITNSIIQMMNGELKVESELEKGSTFTALFYLKLQDTDIRLPMEKLAGQPVLVVDDDKIACDLICMLLDELGMKGESVLSGQEAIDRVTSRSSSE